MIILGKDKIDERYNISDDGVIIDLQGIIQKTYLHKKYLIFHKVPVHKIQAWTKLGWRDTKIWHIHHIDENKLNNNINNLKFVTKSEHRALHKHSEETKQQISEKLKCNKNALGCHRSDETKIKLSKAHIGKTSPMKGKHLSEETRKKLSLAHSGKNSVWYGKKHSEETKRKMSESRKLYWEKKKGIK